MRGRNGALRGPASTCIRKTIETIEKKGQGEASDKEIPPKRKKNGPIMDKAGAQAVDRQRSILKKKKKKRTQRDMTG